MAERRMLLNNSTEESFVGTMFISYIYQNIDKQLNLNLNNNIKIIDQAHHHYESNSSGYYKIGFKRDLIIPERFIVNNNNDVLIIHIESSYNVIFDYNSIIECYDINLQGNFEFNYNSIHSYSINLFDFNYIYNELCFFANKIIFHGIYIQQYYKNVQNNYIVTHPYMLYDLMKYNNIEEGDNKAQNYIISINNKLIISSPTEYITTLPNVNLGNNNYIYSVTNYMYEGNYITEYLCSNNITHLRKGITLPKDATVYFHDTVIDIDSDTFENESNLKKIVIFGNCQLTYLDGFINSNLENIEIYSDKIETIKTNCFNLCENLHNITIPKSIKHIEYNSFDNPGNGLIINYKGTIEDWNDINLEDGWYGRTAGIIIHCTNGDIQL